MCYSTSEFTLQVKSILVSRLRVLQSLWIRVRTSSSSLLITRRLLRTLSKINKTLRVLRVVLAPFLNLTRETVYGIL